MSTQAKVLANRRTKLVPGHIEGNYYIRSHFMQNKPNFRKCKMNITSFITKDYENIPPTKKCENKPNQTQFQPKNEANKPNRTQFQPRNEADKPNQTQSCPPPADSNQRLRGYEWLAIKGRNSFYAQRPVPTGKAGKEALIYMHQEIIEVADGMDNRKANLRAATYSQNMYHRKKRSRAAHLKYKGIYWRKKNRKSQARITFERKRINLAYFRNEIEAAKAYDRAAMKYHGEFASLNFPKTA